MPRSLRLVASLLLLSLAVPFARADAYDAKPKLVIILVFDQFRGDFLDRYRGDFHAPRGWNLFLQQGAHFTDCYYDYANLITAAGHATIGTGAYTDGHGIPLNEWWEQAPDGSLKQTSSVADPRYRIVGAPAGQADLEGTSPHRELATTLGDELVLATGGHSRVFGVSMKDRAAIMTSGHATTGAYWTDHATGTWETSTYWRTDLPQWVQEFNAREIPRARKDANLATENFYERIGRTSISVRYQLEFAQALIANEHLGNNPSGATDMLTLSISSTDINGHANGPDDPSQRALIGQSDALLDAFFNYLDKTVGLQNVVIAMTGDHGIATTQQAGDAARMPVLNFTSALFTRPLEAMLEARYPLKPGQTKYVIAMDNPYLQLNRAAFEAAGLSEEEAENTTKSMLEKVFAGFAKPGDGTAPARLPEPPIVTHIFTQKQLREGTLPDTQYGRLVAHSYSPYIGWGLHINFGPYQFPGTGKTGTTHFSANSYDRHVPLELFGAPFIPGTYHGLVAPVDIAATFASLLRINRPSAAVGRVLTEALHPEGPGSTWSPTPKPVSH